MNVECRNDVLDELSNAFRFNDAVLRNLVIRKKEAVTVDSPIMKGEKESRDRRDRNADYDRSRRSSEKEATEVAVKKDSTDDPREPSAAVPAEGVSVVDVPAAASTDESVESSAEE